MHILPLSLHLSQILNRVSKFHPATGKVVVTVMFTNSIIMIYNNLAAIETGMEQDSEKALASGKYPLADLVHDHQFTHNTLCVSRHIPCPAQSALQA